MHSSRSCDINSFTEKNILCYSLEASHYVVVLIWKHRLEKYLNLEGFLEKSLKMKYALKSTGKLLKSLGKS